MPERTIDIIVPVYRGYESTKRCIESVAASNCATKQHVVVVNDHSPEPELCGWLSEKSKRGEVDLIVHSENLGFVRSVNEAMTLHPDRDAVLLNSDCEVANDWIDRLVWVASTDSRIGTVTPLSNNATICSYPIPNAENPMPKGWSLAELDAIASGINCADPIDIPTAVGSCMFVRRECWNDLGGFDAEVFGHGYGEECDFSARALKAGWRNVAATNIFVFHEGSVSFGESRVARIRQAEALVLTRHPDYGMRVTQFVELDPLAGPRFALSLARARRGHQDACSVASELASEAGIRHTALVEKLGYCRTEARQALAASRTLKVELDTHQAANAELRQALNQAEAFVRAREADIVTLAAEREHIFSELEKTSAELDKIRRRSLIYLARRIIAKLDGVLQTMRNR